MARQLTETHKAAMAAGRVEAAAERSRAKQDRRESFKRWSRSNATLWLAWEENCGKVCDEPCEYCEAYRASNAAMPDIMGDK